MAASPHPGGIGTDWVNEALLTQGGTTQLLEVPTSAPHQEDPSAPLPNCCSPPECRRVGSITCCPVCCTQSSIPSKDRGPKPVHAKSLKSCPTLCGPMDCSPPGSSVHGILQARVLGWALSTPRLLTLFQPILPKGSAALQTSTNSCPGLW